MHILLKDKITYAELKATETMIEDFCILFKQLYGEINCTHNLDLLQHLPKYVKLWGPLWTHSTFCFENKNNLIKNLFHGTTDISQQMLFNIKAESTIQYLLHEIKVQDGEFVAKFISEDSHQKYNMLQIDEHIYAVGNTKLLSLTSEQEETLQYHGNAQGFYRLLKEGIMYHCTNYNQRTRNNTFCAYSSPSNSTLFHFGQIEQFLLEPRPLALVKKIIINSSSLSQQAGYTDHQKLKEYQQFDLVHNIIPAITITQNLEAVDIRNITKKCICITVGPFTYLSAMPNPYERH